VITDSASVVEYVRAGQAVELSSAQIALIYGFHNAVEREVKKVIGYNPEQATYTEFYPERTINSTRDDDGGFGLWDVVGNRATRLERGGFERTEFILKNLPVRSVTSIYENLNAWTTGVANGDFPSNTLLAASQYYLDQSEAGISRTGKLVRSYGIWTSAPRTVKVTYVAGWTAAEMIVQMPEVQLAIKIAVSRVYLDLLARYQILLADGRIEQSTSITDFSIGYQDTQSAGVGGYRNGTSGSASILPEESRLLLSQHVNLARFF
jgi:hypothetical protein